jgi:RNA polymerase primary sigma factor
MTKKAAKSVAAKVGRKSNSRKSKIAAAAPIKGASEASHSLPSVTTALGKSVLTDVEPTAEQLAAEQTMIDEEVQGRRDLGRQTPAPGKDLLASYMEQLSQIPLFTPEQELKNARHLETLELYTWRLILNQPKGAQHTYAEAGELEVPVRTRLEKILHAYRRAAMRSKKKTLPSTPGRTKLIEQAARQLRFADYDKELLERVVRRIRREVWGRRVLDGSPAFRITHVELTEIEQARATGLRARNNFVRANLRLVVSVARNFHHHRIAFIDLIQEGNVGLMKAVHRFDHQRGFRFSTYAHWWIRQSIERAIINKGSQVRLPVHVIDSRRQVGRANAKLTQRLGRAPTPAELSKTLRMPQGKIEQILNGIQQDPVSLDEPVSGDDPRKYLDLVRDDSNPALDEALIRENTHERVRELLTMLNPIEKDIIRRRFGLGDDSDQTLDEIGKLYNLSRERVRQIQAQGLMKMRRMCERRKIS